MSEKELSKDERKAAKKEKKEKRKDKESEEPKEKKRKNRDEDAEETSSKSKRSASTKTTEEGDEPVFTRRRTRTMSDAEEHFKMTPNASAEEFRKEHQITIVGKDMSGVHPLTIPAPMDAFDKTPFAKPFFKRICYSGIHRTYSYASASMAFGIGWKRYYYCRENRQWEDHWIFVTCFSPTSRGLERA